MADQEGPAREPGNDQAGGEHARESPLQCIDRRTPEWTVLPFKVLSEYAAKMGAFAGWVYVALCYHATSRRRESFASYGTLAREFGISRSSVERAIRHLRSLGLIEVVNGMTQKGQRANTINLLDPGSGTTNVGDGARLSEAPSNGRRPPVPQTGGRRPIDGGAPSNRRRQQEGIPEKGSQGKRAPARNECARKDPADELCALFSLLFLGGTPAKRAEVNAEAREQVADLLRLGYSFEQLQAAILDPERDRDEWPRVWRQRIRRAQRPQEAKKRAEAARRASEERKAAQRLLEAKEAKAAPMSFLDFVKTKHERGRNGKPQPD